MRANPGQSATVRRLHEQRERLDALPADEPVRGLRAMGEDQTRFAVRVARCSFGPVHAKDLDALGIEVGQPMDQAVRGRLLDALAREAARGDALRLLRTRSRAQRDLLMRLSRKGHDKHTAAEALDRLAAVGLIDDEAFAGQTAESIARAGAAGPRMAEHKLRALGVDSSLAGKACREAFEGVDMLQRATAAAEKRARSLSPSLDAQTRRRRLYGFLARRGYDHGTCMQATNAVLTEEEAGDDSPDDS